MKRILFVVAASVALFAAEVEAQTGCVVPTIAHSAMGILPDNIHITDAESNVAAADITAGIDLWAKATQCAQSGFLPNIHRTRHVSNETWIVEEDTYTNFQKRHKYVTVVNDLERREVAHVADGRGRSAIDGYFEELGETACAGIEQVAMDMWPAYISSVEAHTDAGRRS